MTGIEPLGVIRLPPMLALSPEMLRSEKLTSVCCVADGMAIEHKRAGRPGQNLPGQCRQQ